MNKFMASMGMISGNWIYQFLQESPDYFVAFERSYFMGIALLFAFSWPWITGSHK